jgi:hypothetical protein
MNNNELPPVETPQAMESFKKLKDIMHRVVIDDGRGDKLVV